MKPHKTKTEIALNSFYMDLLKSNEIISDRFILMFEKDKEKIRKTNKLYASKNKTS